MTAVQKCLAAMKAGGADFSAYNSAESAQDIEAIRQALGYDQINLLGTAYGTRLALTTMRDTPAHIRSVILDSVLPLQTNVFGTASDRKIAAYDKLFAACRADTSCQKTYPTLEEDFYELLVKLEKQPQEIHYPGIDSKERHMMMGPIQFYMSVGMQISFSQGIGSFPPFITTGKLGFLDAFGPMLEALGAEVEEVAPGTQYAVLCNEECEPLAEQVTTPTASPTSLAGFIRSVESGGCDQYHLQ